MSINSELTIVLPIYNPIISWEDELRDSLGSLAILFKKISYKIIVVNDGSSIDLTVSIKYLNTIFNNIEFISYKKNMGKGYAIRTGIKKANSTFYIYTDWDFPFGVKPVYETYKTLKNNNYDVVICERNGSYYKSLPLFRRIMSISLRSINNVLLKFKNIDTQAGLKGLNEKARLVFLKIETNSFIFELEFIKKLINQKLNLGFLKVHPREDIHFTNFSTNTIFNEMINFIKLVYGK